MVVYHSHDNGELFAACDVEGIDPVTGEAEGFTRFHLDDVVILTAAQCVGHDGRLVEVLLSAHVMRAAHPLEGRSS